ncbi:uncharacterized protein ColSpa_11984 [Colletotrichum spaethianum]|uniref:Uncharacterized protein n=1 Tax=Colletotrichum spaethianum TaxID=700344 RepID=A0AA37PGC3_9PEZI|nr:uncharacterized protein ColSpa_11984 [Colletotrichum spaethianum]GKT51803.1 hypothetical protein ColSpa_11984 [Colletotrichum spaethianum]
MANDMLREASVSGRNPEWHFYFRLCLASYQTLYSGFRVAKGIVFSLLSMAIERGVIDLRAANAIRKDFELRGMHHDMSDRVPEYLMVDLDLAMTDPSAAQAETLVQKFHKLQLHKTNDSKRIVTTG